MIQFIKYILIAAMSFSVCFLGCSFVQTTFNIQEWSQFARGVTVFIPFALTLGIILLDYLNGEPK